MKFNEHSGLVGTHAFLSASNYHWVNYDNEKLTEVYRNSQAARRGTELHAFAHDAVRLGIKLPRNGKSLNAYVNDAIGFRMTTEQVLYYSDNAYGCADAIAAYDDLRIHDFKSGIHAGSMTQLKVYAAFYFLEYHEKPGDRRIELRIYQNDEIVVCEPDIDEIAHIMSKIIVFDNYIENLKAEG